MTADERRAEKKRKLKEMFDSLYDNKDSADFYENWKAQTEQQAKVINRLFVWKTFLARLLLEKMWSYCSSHGVVVCFVVALQY